MKSNNEARLVEKIAKGDEAAFSEVYSLYRARIFGFAFRMTTDRSAAEDITHEVFVLLIEHSERFQPERGSLLTFLCAVARNLVMNYLRLKHHLDTRYDQIEGFIDLECGSQDSPLADLLNRELAKQVEKGIAELPPLQREVIILRGIENLSYEEISKITEADLSAVKARLHRARRTLAQRLTTYTKNLKNQYELC